MLASAGIRIVESETPAGHRVSLEGGQVPEAFDMTVPADVSSAAFFMVAAAIVPGSEVRLLEVGVNPTRTGILEVFNQSGVRLESQHSEAATVEPIADLMCWYGPSLRPFTIEGALVPRLIDEIPVLALMATQCVGTSIIRDARELRVKESDRIKVIAGGLREMGANVESFDDGMAISGPTSLKGTRIDADGDHRIAMTFAIAGLIAEGTTEIVGADSIQTSYPGFEADLASLIPT
jgi:3-phosphoshikimate 1-carboxyvinyltransferase